MEKPIPPNPDTMTDEEFDNQERKNTMTETMNERARACYTVHRGAYENWTHGEPAEVWRDENRVLCIRYADGSWFHYAFKPTGLEWW